MLKTAVPAKQTGFDFHAVMNKGCLGVGFRGGCNGIKAQSTELGRETWTTIRDDMADYFGSRFHNSLLPVSLNSADKVGPGVTLTLTSKEMRFAGETKANFALAL